jgi:hypothetical protein
MQCIMFSNSRGNATWQDQKKKTEWWEASNQSSIIQHDDIVLKCM